MTAEQYNELTPFESWMFSATKADYIRNLSTAGVDLFARIYREIYGKSYPLNRNCSACILKLVKIIGGQYYEHQTNQKTGIKKGKRGKAR